eukprot:TRINITY_DN16378_c0_g1_i1.p1 TRINITY_DN16378_c0_g1~~TRINITY_DN16378_c0_g1_i1.p1  ORF type:complete len:195 (+),score=46.77 TRINITY_DN16378_c0_g1_i1:30-587(+)
MASVMRIVSRGMCAQQLGCFGPVRHLQTGPARLGGPLPWNYLWKPGPYPENEDQRLAAAKKYGLIPEDYKPYPKDSDRMTGDYPDLPLVPEGHRNAMYEWDYPQYRRDYGEPLHEDFDMYRETRYTPFRGRWTEGEMWRVFLGILAFMSGTWYIAEYYLPHYQRPVLELQRITDGPHYTFEPADE